MTGTLWEQSGGSLESEALRPNGVQTETSEETRHTLVEAEDAAASHAKDRNAPSCVQRVTNCSRGGAAPFSLTAFRK